MYYRDAAGVLFESNADSFPGYAQPVTELSADDYQSAVDDLNAAQFTAVRKSPAQALAVDQTDALMAALPDILQQLATGDGTDPLSVALQQVIKGVG